MIIMKTAGKLHKCTALGLKRGITIIFLFKSLLSVRSSWFNTHILGIENNNKKKIPFFVFTSSKIIISHKDYKERLPLLAPSGPRSMVHSSINPYGPDGQSLIKMNPAIFWISVSSKSGQACIN